MIIVVKALKETHIRTNNTSFECLRVTESIWQDSEKVLHVLQLSISHQKQPEKQKAMII